MLNFSNVLSLSRAAFALIFLQNNIFFRLLAILGAMISDFLDGYLARKQKTASQFGAILDPIMDKFFVFFAGGILFLEQKITIGELAALLSRDFSLCLFGIYLLSVRGWKGYECKAIFWGKITTAFQFLFLIGITMGLIFPSYLYLLFVLMATFAFFELVTTFRKVTK